MPKETFRNTLQFYSSENLEPLIHFGNVDTCLKQEHFLLLDTFWKVRGLLQTYLLIY